MVNKSLFKIYGPDGSAWYIVKDSSAMVYEIFSDENCQHCEGCADTIGEVYGIIGDLIHED